MNHADTPEVLAEKIAISARDLAPEIDRERRLPAELVARLNEAGMLRATMPREVDALELSPPTALRCAEAIARGDAATGWCVSIAITSALLVAYLPDAARDEMFGGGRGVAAGVWAPRGKATSVDGGVVVSGRWPFCSGITHADMLFAGCFVDEGRVPSVVALPKEDLRVLDNWHTLGLRGTGSHDTVAEEVFVPAERVFSVFDGPRVDRPLYRFPVFGFFALSVAAAALGNARGDRRSRRAGGRQKGTRVDAHPGGALGDAGRRGDRGVGAERGPRALLRGDRSRVAGQSGSRARHGGPAQPAAAGGHPCRPHVCRRGALHVRLGGKHRYLRHIALAATIP